MSSFRNIRGLTEGVYLYVFGNEVGYPTYTSLGSVTLEILQFNLDKVSWGLSKDVDIFCDILYLNLRTHHFIYVMSISQASIVLYIASVIWLILKLVASINAPILSLLGSVESVILPKVLGPFEPNVLPKTNLQLWVPAKPCKDPGQLSWPSRRSFRAWENFWNPCGYIFGFHLKPYVEGFLVQWLRIRSGS